MLWPMWSSSSDKDRPRLRRPPAEELVGDGVGLYRRGFRWTSEFAREEDGDPAELLFLDWYNPSAEVSEPDTGGERGS